MGNMTRLIKYNVISYQVVMKVFRFECDMVFIET